MTDTYIQRRRKEIKERIMQASQGLTNMSAAITEICTILAEMEDRPDEIQYSGPDSQTYVAAQEPAQAEIESEEGEEGEAGEEESG